MHLLCQRDGLKASSRRSSVQVLIATREKGGSPGVLANQKGRGKVNGIEASKWVLKDEVGNLLVESGGNWNPPETLVVRHERRADLSVLIIGKILFPVTTGQGSKAFGECHN